MISAENRKWNVVRPDYFDHFPATRYHVHVYNTYVNHEIIKMRIL